MKSSMEQVTFFQEKNMHGTWSTFGKKNLPHLGKQITCILGLLKGDVFSFCHQSEITIKPTICEMVNPSK